VNSKTETDLRRIQSCMNPSPVASVLVIGRLSALAGLEGRYHMTEPIREACVAFIHSLFNAKQSASSEEDFWKNRSANRAYQQMFKVIREETPDDIGWQAGFWECAGGYSYQVWEGQPSEDELAVEFVNTITNTLKMLATVEWIACVPMERPFRTFPEFTDFGPFAVVNARRDDLVPEADLCSATFVGYSPTDSGSTSPHLREFENRIWS
jgi:hypothetical protein